MVSENLPQTGYIRQAQLIPTFVPISAPTLWRWVKTGHFPKPVKLSSRITAWRVEDVHAWLDSYSMETKCYQS